MEGGKDSIKWRMIRHIFIATPINRQRYQDIFNSVHLPKIALLSTREIDSFYSAEDLQY